MTADEFIRVYGAGDDDRHELIEGEVCERTLNGYSHDRVKNNLKNCSTRQALTATDTNAGLNTVLEWRTPAS